MSNASKASKASNELIDWETVQYIMHLYNYTIMQRLVCLTARGPYQVLLLPSNLFVKHRVATAALACNIVSANLRWIWESCAITAVVAVPRGAPRCLAITALSFRCLNRIDGSMVRPADSLSCGMCRHEFQPNGALLQAAKDIHVERLAPGQMGRFRGSSKQRRRRNVFLR